MKNRRFRRSLCLVCLSLPVVWATVVTGQAAVGESPGEPLSVLDRVQKENDRELSELIRLAVLNRKLTEKETFEIVRKVTQSYAQIRLLDQQIAQIARKAEAPGGPAEMRYELLLAKAELESRRTTELANLREVMGVIPRFPLEKKPVETLNAWLRLKVIDQRVYVIDAQRPFLQDWAEWRAKSLGLMSEKETLDYVRSRLADKGNLPIRIDIYQLPAAAQTAEELRSAIIKLIYEAGAEMDAEVRQEQPAFVGVGTCTYFLRGNDMWTFYPRPVRRPDNDRSRRLATGRIAREDLEQHILWRLLHPGNVPLKFQIDYDEAGATLAKQVADRVKAVAKGLGLADVVEVVGALVEPVPEAAFLGRWEAVTKSDLQTIEVQPQGVCLLTLSVGPRAGKPASCQWLPTTKEMIVEVPGNVVGSSSFAYRGYLNADGNLVIDQGVIYIQGSFHLSGPGQMVFRKVP